jgi:AAA domain
VVVIDTLNRALGELSENDGGDMGKLIKAADAIRHRFGCAVVIIHHCGIEGTRPRGHSSLSGAYDALIAVVKNETGLIKVTVEALRDDEPMDPFYCRLENVELGQNDRAASLHSCVVVHEDHTCTASASKSARKVTANQQRFLDILAEAIHDAPTAHRTKENIPGDRTAITRMWLKMVCHTKGWLDPEATENNHRAKLSNMIDALAGRRLIGVTAKYIWDAR